MNRRTRQLIMVLATMGAMLILSGCGYTLRGKVVQGQTSGMEVVHSSDPRLAQWGIDNVDVSVRVKPTTRDVPALTGRRYTSEAGHFAIRLDDLGSAVEHQEWQVQARRRGYQSATGIVKLPKGHKWHVLITIAQGSDEPALDAEESE